MFAIHICLYSKNPNDESDVSLAVYTIKQSIKQHMKQGAFVSKFTHARHHRGGANARSHTELSAPLQAAALGSLWPHLQHPHRAGRRPPERGEEWVEW